MKEPVYKSRRRFIKSTAAMAAMPFVVVSGCSVSDDVDRKLKFASLFEGIQEAERLANAASVTSTTAFSLPQTLVHCAQSIEYSMQGFPVPKSAAFQKTLGNAAFGLFSWRGRMSHDLAEPIPGAAPLDNSISIEVALHRLQLSVDTFLQVRGDLQPHFAYGDLDKEEYELAHAMHLANHFSVFDT